MKTHKERKLKRIFFIKDNRFDADLVTGQERQSIDILKHIVWDKKKHKEICSESEREDIEGMMRWRFYFK